LPNEQDSSSNHNSLLSGYKHDYGLDLGFSRDEMAPDADDDIIKEGNKTKYSNEDENRQVNYTPKGDCDVSVVGGGFSVDDVMKAGNNTQKTVLNTYN
jgi:hypothetical protein